MQAAASLEHVWQEALEPQDDVDPFVMLPSKTGDAVAVMHIPRFSREWRRPVIEGTSLEELARGVGHYSGTALPGEVGNFAVAGHRLTNGSAFAKIDELVAGDVVAVHTPTDWYVYEVTGSEIVRPDQIEVVAPVPGHPGQAPTERLLTLTSCHPRYSSRQRYIVHARLIHTQSAADGVPDSVKGGAA